MNYLLVIGGPTAVGKTAVSIALAQHFGCEIISADSRQIYQQMQIGTARPYDHELNGVPHHLLAHVSVEANYDVSRFESEALECIITAHKTNNLIILSGGTGLYIDAVCKGIDTMPDPDLRYREVLNQLYKTQGIEPLQKLLYDCDYDYYLQVDKQNPARLIRAIEIFQTTGIPYSQFRTQTHKTRPFEIIKIALDMPRETLYGRINKRVEQMIENGLIDEVKRLKPYQHLNPLNTVGYKELFAYFDGNLKLSEAVEQIQNHSRAYARKQLTWLRKDPAYNWFNPNEIDRMIAFVNERIQN